MTYDELFQLKGLEKAKLLAGKSILSREILGAHVIEMTEAQEWVKRGELIFISGVAFQDPQKDLIHAIRSLAKRQVAGVVIEVGPYIPNVEDQIIDLSNELNMPLLSLPYEVSVSEIISQIYFDIYNKEEANKSIEKFMAEIIYGDTQKALERIELFKFDQNKRHCALYIGLDCRDEQKPERGQMEQLLWAVRMSLIRQEQLLYLPEDDGVVAICELQYNENMHQSMEEKRAQIQKNLQFHVKDATISMGVGNAFGGVDAIKDSVIEAKKAYRVLRSCQVQQGVRYYDEIGIYRIFFDLKSEEVLRHLFQEILGDLVAYDEKNNSEMVYTLEKYLEEDCNIAKTTEQLFLHRNTVKYRIKRIEDILGKDLKDVTVQFNLRLAFKIKRYLIG